MKKGRVIIDFESDEKGECSWNILQQGRTKLNDKNLANLFETILGELYSDEFSNVG